MVARVSKIVLNSNGLGVLGSLIGLLLLSWITVEGCNIAAEEFKTKPQSQGFPRPHPLSVPDMARHPTSINFRVAEGV